MNIPNITTQNRGHKGQQQQQANRQTYIDIKGGLFKNSNKDLARHGAQQSPLAIESKQETTRQQLPKQVVYLCVHHFDKLRNETSLIYISIQNSLGRRGVPSP